MKAEQDLAQGLGCWVGCRLVLSPESWGRDPGREGRHAPRRGSRREGGADPPCPGLPPQRLYSMDLRSSHKAKGKEKLCFSLTRPLGSGSPKGVVKAGAPELADKGPLVPTLPFPLRKPRKAHKYLRLSRKKFPPRGPNLESHSHRRELFLQESPAQDVLQAASEWEPAEQPPEEEGKAARPPAQTQGPSELARPLELSGPREGPLSLRGTLAPSPEFFPWCHSEVARVQPGKINVVTSPHVASLELGSDLAGDSEEDLVLGVRGPEGGFTRGPPCPLSPPCCQRCPPPPAPSVCLSVYPSVPRLQQRQTWARGPLLGHPRSPQVK